MRILLKKVLEKFLLVLFFVVIIFGNIVLIYNLKNKFVNINSIDKDQKIDFSIFIIDSNEKENFINLLNNEIMVNNKIYECDFNISSKLKEIMK